MHKQKIDETEQLKENNDNLISALRTLCEILKEHNKNFTNSAITTERTMNTNLSGGTLSQASSIDEMEVHSPLIICVSNLLKNVDKLKISETRQTLQVALESSVLYLSYFIS